MENQNRRRFIKGSVLAAPVLFPGVLSFVLSACNSKMKPTLSKIDKIEVYRYDVTLPRYFSFGVYKNRQVAFLKLTSGDYIGWGEMNATINKPEMDMSEWGKFLNSLKGMAVKDAFLFLESKRKDKDWGWHRCELVEMALFDLWGKIEDKPAIEILGLSNRAPLPGLFPILEEDIEKVKDSAREALKRNYTSHIKLKIFGKKEFDGDLIAAVRNEIGPDAYLVCDPNAGYKSWESLDELAEIIRYLGDKGMSGCEDPGVLSTEQWITLQKKVQPISVIPDVILRPSWKALKEGKPGMGNVYNLHPGSMGSIKHTVELAAKIKNWGHELMIGDASIVGPACSIWQQLAIGMGASWVEAIEKPIESDNYLKCLASKPTYRTKDGKIAMTDKSGFGIDMDEGLLKEVCSQKAVL